MSTKTLFVLGPQIPETTITKPSTPIRGKTIIGRYAVGIQILTTLKQQKYQQAQNAKKIISLHDASLCVVVKKLY